MAGLGGALYAHYMRFISATDFSFPMSITFLSMIVLGGMGTLWGPLLGAVLLGILPELFRPIVDYRILFYTALLLVMIRFQPAGLPGGWAEIRDSKFEISKGWPGGNSEFRILNSKFRPTPP